MLHASVKALASNGIYVDEEAIPAQKYTQCVICMNSSSDSHLTAAQSVLGEIVAEYSLPDGITYQSEKAYISYFDNGNFEYGLLKNRHDNTTVLSTTPPENIKKLTSNLAKKLKKSFKRFTDPENSFTYTADGYIEQNGVSIVYSTLYIDGMAVHNGAFVCVFSDDELIYFSGKYFFDSFEAFYEKEYIDAPNALFLLKKDNVSVKNIRMVYYPVISTNNEYFLIPSWEITTTNDDIKIFDGVSGFERQ